MRLGNLAILHAQRLTGGPVRVWWSPEPHAKCERIGLVRRLNHRSDDPALIRVADGKHLQARLCKQVPGTGHEGAAVIPGRGRVPVVAVMHERAVVLHFGEDSGSGEFCVHPST